MMDSMDNTLTVALGGKASLGYFSNHRTRENIQASCCSQLTGFKARDGLVSPPRKTMGRASKVSPEMEKA